MTTKTRLWGVMLLVLVLGLFAVLAAAAQEATEEAATMEATEEATEAATEEATEAATEEATEAATMEATEEATEAATEEATEAATEEAATMEATEEATEEATVAPLPTASAANEYVIQPGDTLFAIANRFGVSVTDLAEANDIVNPSRIFWGLTLQIPVDDAGDAGDDTGQGGPTATEEATATPEPDDEDTTTLATYTVRTGDNLYRISLQYNTTIARLVQLNPVITNENIIYVGQEILVPAS